MIEKKVYTDPLTGEPILSYFQPINFPKEFLLRKKIKIEKRILRERLYEIKKLEEKIKESLSSTTDTVTNNKKNTGQE